MTIGSVGNVSFYTQDQNYWNNAQAQSAATSADNSLISVLGSAQTSLSKGLSKLATQAALTRTNNQITSQLKSLEASATQAASTSAANAKTTPATGTGTIPLTASTPLSTLGIPPNGTISVGDGTSTTVYSSTGSDTVADLIGAINSNAAGNAYATASLNGSGQLVITAKNNTETLSIGGVFASDVGFGQKNNFFQPTKVSSTSSTTSTASTSSTTASTASSSSTSKAAAKTTTKTDSTTVTSEIDSSAETLLSGSGATGLLVDMLA
jgi:hypothetical protein